MLGVYLEVYSVFGYEPKQTEWGPRSRGPQTATSPDPEKTLYYKMRSFNHTLSSQRITIERAFGQLVRNWGILWCANSSRLKNVSLMVQCCAKLHNICVQRWLIDGRSAGLNVATELEIVPEQMNIEDADRPDDNKVAERLTNRYVGIDTRAARSDLRIEMMNMIWNTGLRITLCHPSDRSLYANLSTGKLPFSTLTCSDITLNRQLRGRCPHCTAGKHRSPPPLPPAPPLPQLELF